MNDIPESAQTQREKLLGHLKAGLHITAHRALYGYGVRQLGHQIERRMEGVQARFAVRQLAAGSSLNAVSRLVGVPQPTLHRFLTKEGSALSLKNFEKIALYIEAHQRPVGD